MPRGRKPKPIDLQSARTRRRMVALIEQAPRFSGPEDLTPPGGLDEPALSAWSDLAPGLQQAGVLREPDLRTLEAYCIAWSNLRAAQQALDLHGPVLVNENSGVLYKNPASTVVNESLTQLARFGAMLGLDPANRSRVDVGTPPADAENPFTRLKRDD